MKKEVLEKTLAYIPKDFDGVILDLRSNLDGEFKNAQVDTLKDVDGTIPQFDNSVDIVFCKKLHKIKNTKKALEEISRVLKDGGKLVACLKPYDSFRSDLKDIFNVNSYHTMGHYAYFEAEKRSS